MPSSTSITATTIATTTAPTLASEAVNIFRGSLYMDAVNPEQLTLNQTAQNSLSDIIERGLVQAIPGVERSMVDVSSIHSLQLDDGVSEPTRRLKATDGTAANAINDSVVIALYALHVPAP